MFRRTTTRALVVLVGVAPPPFGRRLTNYA